MYFFSFIYLLLELARQIKTKTHNRDNSAN